ncbi:MAG: hypothetical protein ACRD4O_07780, partial [Bryobacteraceae bacterium]
MSRAPASSSLSIANIWNSDRFIVYEQDNVPQFRREVLSWYHTAVASWSRSPLYIVLVALSTSLAARSLPFTHGGRWTELNIGPFYVDTQGDLGEARHELTQMEQVRWVLGGLLEVQDLPSLWPIRVVFTKEEVPAQIGFEWQDGQFLLVCPEGTHVPLGAVAGILLDANMPRLPVEVESGLRELFSTLEARGSRVTWGGAPAHPDLA